MTCIARHCSATPCACCDRRGRLQAGGCLAQELHWILRLWQPGKHYDGRGVADCLRRVPIVVYDRVCSRHHVRIGRGAMAKLRMRASQRGGSSPQSTCVRSENSACCLVFLVNGVTLPEGRLAWRFSWPALFLRWCVCLSAPDNLPGHN